MQKNELAVIKQAIQNEIEGYEFYKMAANQSGGGGSKEALMELANEELKHVEFLKALYTKIKDGTDDDISLAYETGLPSPEIYKWDRLDKSLISMAMSVFGIGIQMEKDAIEFYTDAMNNSQNEEAKKIYETLIKWEKIHMEQFTEQYNI